MKYYHFGKSQHVQIASSFNPDPIEALREGTGPFLIILDNDGPTASGEAITVLDEFLMCIARMLRPFWSQPESVHRALEGQMDVRSMAAAQAGEAFVHYSLGRQLPDLPHPQGVGLPVSASAALVTQLIMQGQWKAATKEGGLDLYTIINILETASMAMTAQVNGESRQEATRAAMNAFRSIMVSMLSAWGEGKDG